MIKCRHFYMISNCQRIRKHLQKNCSKRKYCSHKQLQKMIRSVTTKNKKINVKKLVAHGRQTHKKEYR